MRIAYLNPWRGAAENQAYQSLRIAAERIGHELIHCANSAEIDACSPAFVLATASSQAKLNDFPHYGVVHEPRDRFLLGERYFNNLRTYDGWMSISDTLIRFSRDVACSLGRNTEIGFYYNTPQRQTRSANLESLLRERRLRLTYFGTNWDNRRKGFFSRLSEAPGVVICGPGESWKGIDRKSYGGSLPFDGASVQAQYAENGAGLCLLSHEHFRDDVISNRVFEITSVGAIAICCDIPWLRKHFGDSLYYFDQRLPDTLLAREILAIVGRIYADPAAALQRAAHAREVFESRFAGEVLIANAVGHHLKTAERRSRLLAGAKQRYSPLISVIVRCGTRPPEIVRRALESLVRQTYGRFHVILVRHRDVDLSWLDAQSWPNVDRIEILECPGGNCSKTLWAGLARVEGDYFSVLDDDDWLFSNHFEELFSPLPHAPQSGFFAYSGAVAVDGEPHEIMGGSGDRRHVIRYGILPGGDLDAISGAISSNGFVASRDLLHPALLEDPVMDTAEDSYLILSLAGNAAPRFSYAATSVVDLSASGRVHADNHPRRFEDCLTLHTRLSAKFRPPAARPDVWESLREQWELRPSGAAVSSDEDATSRIYRDSTYFLSTLSSSDLVPAAEGWDVRLSRLTDGCGRFDSSTSALPLTTPRAPWSYAVQLYFKRPKTSDAEHLLRVELTVHSGRVGLGLLNNKESEFLFRLALPAMEKTQIVYVPVAGLAATGNLVVQTWDQPGPCIVTVKRVQLMAARVR